MKKHLIDGKAGIVEALDALNRLSGETMTLFVVDSSDTLIGSLTDGDIRRALLSGRSLADPIETICNRHCLMIDGGRDETGVIAKARAANIALLPVVLEGKVVSLIDLHHQRGLVDADAVLMAGGRGERLRPLTDNTPKPLLPVGGRPVIDHNVELLHQFGIHNIFVTVNYLGRQIASHFEGTDVKIVREPERLGTIGALSLIDSFRSPNIIVMNADLLTDINLEAMYLKHIETEAWLTMAVIPYTVSVPYAIVEHEKDRVTGFSEKPTYNYYANAGIYMLRREAAALVAPGKFMDATDLIDLLIRDNKRVSLYNLDGRWIDIGSPDDYRHACEIMKT